MTSPAGESAKPSPLLVGAVAWTPSSGAADDDTAGVTAVTGPLATDTIDPLGIVTDVATELMANDRGGSLLKLRTTGSERQDNK